MRILITGGRGYLGSVLIPMLLAARHDVVSLERPAPPRLAEPVPDHPGLSRQIMDIRRPHAHAFDGVEVVICLAAVPNRTSAATPGPSASEINRDASVVLARSARENGVRRFLFASSCSVYGAAAGLAGEDAPVSPLTAYAYAKVEAERRLGALACPRFTVTSLRLATLFGPSPRLRRDLIVNAMVWSAVTEGSVAVPQPGLRRPLVHVRDAAEAFVLCLAGPSGHPASGVFNVAGLNTTTDRVARFVAERLGARTRPNIVSDDARDYWVDGRSFEQATGKERWRGLDEGIDELRDQMAVQPRNVRSWTAVTGRDPSPEPR